MFETVLGRLQALAQAEGFDPQPGTVIDGELRAYAAGIALVYDQLTTPGRAPLPPLLPKKIFGAG